MAKQNPMNQKTVNSIFIILVIMMLLLHGGISFAAATEPEESSPHNAEEGNSIFATIARWLNFAGLAAILYFFLVRIMDVPGSFKKLSSGLAHAIKSSTESKEAALQQIQDIKGKLVNLDDEVNNIKEEVLKNTEFEKNKIAAEGEEEIKRIQQFTHAEIDWKMKEAIKDLKQHTIEMATSLSEQIIKSQLKPEDQEKLIEQFIVDLRNRN
jgi:F-type H+-transporting ATPase subunit b